MFETNMKLVHSQDRDSNSSWRKVPDTSLHWYPPVNVYITMENPPIFHGTIHYFDWTIFNSKLCDITRPGISVYPMIIPFFTIVNPLLNHNKSPFIVWHNQRVFLLPEGIIRSASNVSRWLSTFHDIPMIVLFWLGKSHKYLRVSPITSSSTRAPWDSAHPCWSTLGTSGAFPSPVRIEQGQVGSGLPRVTQNMKITIRFMGKPQKIGKTYGFLENFWLVVFRHPSEKYESQLGWWNSQLNGKS